MPAHIRIVEIGAINTGDRQWQFAAPDQIPFWRDLAKETEVIRLLDGQGAVCVEIDANYDEDYHEAAEEYGLGMTYGEYWELHPDRQPQKPIPCWQRWILLSVSAPFMQWLSPAGDCTLIAEWKVGQWHEDWEQRDYRFYLTLTSATSPAPESALQTVPKPSVLRLEVQPPVIQPSQISPLFRDCPTPVSGHRWQLGEGMTLQPLDYETPPSAIAHLETWLRTTPIAQLPRHVTVKLPRRLGSTYGADPGYSRIVSANARILWHWSFDG